LFFWHVPLPSVLGGHAHHGGQASYSAHLQGMWLAHALGAMAIATFVSALSRALRRERERSERTARLLGLATLAAGAAHEIGNPLATIRVAAGELERDLLERGLSGEELADLRLIDGEVGRASRVLERLAASAGELMGESPVALDLHEVVAVVLERVGERAERVATSVPASGEPVRWPVQAVSQALLQLVRNALDASAPDARVQVVACPERDGVRIDVHDRGRGMAPAVLERVGEPFFTTRPGQGMGLGVFIARSLVEHLGGQLELESTPGQGTVARVWLPGGVRS
jgi:two-component system sensor histidine kinase RegB